MISPNDGTESRYSSKTLESLVSRVFEPSSWLQTALNLEHRPQQAQMARAVCNSMSQDSPLIFEAGTGVGKSLAYLIPGIIHSSESKRPCIVTSNTISPSGANRRKGPFHLSPPIRGRSRTGTVFGIQFSSSRWQRELPLPHSSS